LTFVEEQLGQGWAATLKGVLGEGKQAVDAARARGEAGLPTEVRQAFTRRYDAALEEGARANPPAPPTGTRGRPTRGKAGSLVDRLRTHKEATLAFLSDTTIPFDNNQAERDIRMTKVRERRSQGASAHPPAARASVGSVATSPPCANKASPSSPRSARPSAVTPSCRLPADAAVLSSYGDRTNRL